MATLLEIRQGIGRMEGKDEAFAGILERWLRRVKPASEHRVVLVTRNVTEFEDVAGLAVVDPWGYRR